jgi:flagellin
MNSVRFSWTANSLTRNAAKSTEALQEAVGRMSSGKKVVNARDDASGLAISVRLGTKIEGAARSGIEIESVHSMLRIMDGNLDKIGEMLNRMVELSVQAANDTNSAGDRLNLEKEFILLKEEIGHIASNATYNGVSLFSASPGVITVHASERFDDTIGVSQQDVSVIGLGIDALTLTSQGDSETALDALMDAVGRVAGYRATAGGEMNRLGIIRENLMAGNIEAQSSVQRIVDADIGAEMTAMVMKDIRMKTTISLLSKVNESRGNIVKLLES